ncbi:MAG: HAD family hydrolase [Desulfobulbaceae bacterium]|nr:HAD family hydrolase [Desulfobulbaceae bacterium]
MNFKAAIFDLDGTLLDTLEDIADAVNTVLQRKKFPAHDVAAYRYFVGDGVNILMTRVLPEEKRDDNTVAECVELFREEYSQNYNIKTRLYEGIPEMLDELTARGLKLAVLSNKPDNFVKQCVAEFLRKWHFEVVLGHHNGIPHKPDPTGAIKLAAYMETLPEQILYLGDTDIDMKTAVSARMFPVGALWGFRHLEELKTGGAKKVIERPMDILGLL